MDEQYFLEPSYQKFISKLSFHLRIRRSSPCTQISKLQDNVMSITTRGLFEVVREIIMVSHIRNRKQLWWHNWESYKYLKSRDSKDNCHIWHHYFVWNKKFVKGYWWPSWNGLRNDDNSSSLNEEGACRNISTLRLKSVND